MSTEVLHIQKTFSMNEWKDQFQKGVQQPSFYKKMLIALYQNHHYRRQQDLCAEPSMSVYLC